MDNKDNRLEIMMRVFIDDLETTLSQDLNAPSLDLINPKGFNIDQVMKDYLKVHFKIMLDNKPQIMNYLGHELEGEAFIFYIEVSPVKKWKTIRVMNDIIIEKYNDQSNLVHVTVFETVKSLRLTKSRPTDELTF